MSRISCQYCVNSLNKDCIALNKKILGRNIKKFMCITCLADFLGCEEADLFIKIQEFKEQGCGLFDL